MSNEITTVTLDDVTHGYLIEPTLIAALSEQPGLASRMCREFVIKKGTNTIQLPVEAAYWGSPNDRGAGVATQFNQVQAVAMGNTPVTTNGVQCTSGEYGVAHALTDNTDEDTVDGIDLMQLFTGQMLKVMTLAMDDDYVAMFPSLSQTVGTTNTAPTLVQLIAAQTGLRTRGAVADALTYVLGNITAGYLESVIMAASTSMAVYALSADRLINYAPTANNGMDASRVIGQLRGVPIVATGLTDTINAGVDESSACICPSTANNDVTGASTHAQAWKRFPRFETQRQAKGRLTELVMTARCGFAELQDGAGTQIFGKST